MKATEFLAILFAIPISNHEVLGTNDNNLQFVDDDFLDYEEVPVGETKREINFLDDPRVISTEAVLKKSEIFRPDKAIAIPRSKRDASFTSLSSIENENTETIFKRIEKLNPEKAKELLREKRDVQESLKGTMESIFTKAKTLDPKKAKDMLRARRTASLSDVAPKWLKVEDIESIFTTVEKLGLHKAKDILRANRELTVPDTVPPSGKVDVVDVKFRRNGKLKADKKSKRPAAESKKKHDQKVLETSMFKQEHDMKIQEIMDFMKLNYYTSTNYIYDEIQRIKRDGKIRDKLRLLVQYLEMKDHEKLKESVLKCYYSNRVIDKPYANFWNNRDPNNLIINGLKDPYTNE